MEEEDEMVELYMEVFYLEWIKSEDRGCVEGINYREMIFVVSVFLCLYGFFFLCDVEVGNWGLGRMLQVLLVDCRSQFWVSVLLYFFYYYYIQQ